MFPLFSESPAKTLEMFKEAMEQEMNSVTNCLRNTFLNKIPTEEEIALACSTLAEKLRADVNAKNDVKLALMDLLEEALQGRNRILSYSSFPSLSAEITRA